MSLTQDDEKTYWGKITEVGQGATDDIGDKTSKKVEIDGAIMLGTGLEPCSIGRFRMVEMKDGIIDQDYKPNNDGGYISMSPDDVAMNVKRFDLLFDDTDDSSSSQGSFDFPSGAFE